MIGAVLARGVRATRKPRLLFRFVGVFLLRFAERRFWALLFQPPPRFTRFEQRARQVLPEPPLRCDRETLGAFGARFGPPDQIAPEATHLTPQTL